MIAISLGLSRFHRPRNGWSSQIGTTTLLGTTGPLAQWVYSFLASRRFLLVKGPLIFSARNRGLVSMSSCMQVGRRCWISRVSKSMSEDLPDLDLPAVKTRSPGLGIKFEMCTGVFRFSSVCTWLHHFSERADIFRQSLIIPVAYPGDNLTYLEHEKPDLEFIQFRHFFCDLIGESRHEKCHAAHHPGVVLSDELFQHEHNAFEARDMGCLSQNYLGRRGTLTGRFRLLFPLYTLLRLVPAHSVGYSHWRFPSLPR